MKMGFNGRQGSFAEVTFDPAWASTRPPRPPVSSPPLLPTVRQQARHFETSAVAQGVLRASSARTYRKELECTAKQAHRFLGRPLADLAELYTVELIAGVARDDQPLDPSTVRLARSTLRLRRTVLAAYLRVIGVPGLTFEEGMAALKAGFRRAARRRGDRYIIGAGRPERRDYYMPPLEDVLKFLSAAPRVCNGVLGHALAAAAALALFHGLRPVSILSTQGTDFRWVGKSLRLMYREKGVKAKAPCAEIELRPQVIPYLVRYVNACELDAIRKEQRPSVAFGMRGTFFRGLAGRPLRYDSLRGAFARCCKTAGICPFTSYGLRHLYSSGLATVLSVAEAAVAGGWKNEEVFLRHYAHSLRRLQPSLLQDEPLDDLDIGSPGATELTTEDAGAVHD